MGQNTLPPGAETFLSSETGGQLESALSSVYQNIMVDTAVKNYLTKMGIDLGVPKPPVMFSDDNLWRAIVRAVAFGKRHTRTSVVKVFELILGPQVSQVSVLNKTIYSQVAVGDTLNVTAATDPANIAAYTVAEVLTHHLIFPAGTFNSVNDFNVSYNIRNTFSTYGNLIELSDGRHALVDNSVMFTNTHPRDFLTRKNTSVPQYGRVIFNKNSPASETFDYAFYDKYITGILKLDSSQSVPSNTRNKYVPIRSSTLSASSQTGDLSVSILDDTNFPVSLAPVSRVQLNIDSVTILTPGVAGGPFLINGSVLKHEITIAPAAFTLPASPDATEILYEITTGATGTLDGGRGHFLSKKGKILSTSRLVDYSVDFTELLRPHVDSTTEPFTIIINRGGNNEETIEVVYRAGTVLYLVGDPNKPNSATSLLKFNHAKGESVEVYSRKTTADSAYYPITAADAIVSTADGASSVTELHDATALFNVTNASLTYGDEVEIVSVPAGNINIVGTRRTITVFNLLTHVTVGPAFPDTLLGCTYRVRKLYKAGIDNRIYLEDSSIFPQTNFSVILNRGKDDEEVVWCDVNVLAGNTIRVINNDIGTAFVSKNHDFGMTVEPAQVLIESCNWDVIETRATGEFTLAVEESCVSPVDAKDAWFLHEETPFWLTSNSTTAQSAVPIAGTTEMLPSALLQSAIAAADSSFNLFLSDFLRVFANNIDPYNTQSIDQIFRAGLLSSAAVEEDFFITTANGFGSLQVGAVVGATEIITDVSFSGVINIGNQGSKYPNRAEAVTVVTSSLGGDGKWTITFAAPGLVYSHSYGESVLPNIVNLNVTSPFENSWLISSPVFLLTVHKSYRHIEDFTTSTTFFTGVTPAGETNFLVSVGPTGLYFPKEIIGKSVYIKSTVGSVAPFGERRKIVSVGGPDSNYIYVDPPFSAQVPTNSTFLVKTYLQEGDPNISFPVPMGDTNSAFGLPGAAPLNNKNYNKYSGGHKSSFPGSYIYRELDDEGGTVDQPTSYSDFLRSGPLPPGDPDANAVYKFPGPRRLIARPLIPYSVTTNDFGFGANNLLRDDTSAVILAAALTAPIVDDDPRIVGRGLEILSPDTRRDWRSSHKIVKYTVATNTFEVAPSFSEFPWDPTSASGASYRIFGTDPAITPDTTITPGQNIFWVDYPELFPDPVQGDFKVTISRELLKEVTVDVTSCVNSLTANYGQFTLSPTTPAFTDIYGPGESVELLVSKITLPSAGNMPEFLGGFYCEFGFDKTLYLDEDIGISSYLGNSTIKSSGGAESKGVYEYTDGAIDTLEFLKYAVPESDLDLPIPSVRNIAFRAVLGTISTNDIPNNTANFRIVGENLVHQKYKDNLVGGTVQILANVGTVVSYKTYKILSISPGDSTSCVIQVSPFVENPTAPGAALALPIGTQLVVRGEMRTDDQEPKLRSDSYVALLKSLPTSPAQYRVFTDTQTSAVSANNDELSVLDLAPLTTALIGRTVMITNYGGIVGAPAVGTKRIIVDIKSSVSPDNNDILLLDSTLGLLTPSGVTFSIMPYSDLNGGSLYHGGLVGGVYTPVGTGHSIVTAPTFFGNTRFPAGREYGILQEYVGYDKRVGSVLTLNAPHYFKYDHPPGTKINYGSGAKITAGDGTDYRPYIFFSGFLGVLFNAAVGFKNLFTAAGIECKNEETELGP